MSSFITSKIAADLGINGSHTIYSLLDKLKVQTVGNVQLSETYYDWAKFGVITDAFILELLNSNIKESFIELLMENIGEKFCVSPIFSDGYCVEYVRTNYL